MNIQELWPELAWIEDQKLRQATTKTWQLALERSALTPEDLNKIPFTLLAGPDLQVSFMAHKRCVVHVARESALKMIDFFGDVPFLYLGQEPEGASIYASENIKITKIEATSLHTEYNRLSSTFKNIVVNMATCMSVTADMVCSSLTSKISVPADSNVRQGE